MDNTASIEIVFGAPVAVSREHQQRLVSLIGEICDAYEFAHPDRVMWPAGIGDKPSGMWTGEPTFDASIFQIDCCERERFDGEELPKAGWTYERQVIADAIGQIGWAEIDAYRAELANGQSVDEDAGGFMVRAIARLFRLRRRRDPIVTYQNAARALFADQVPA